MNRRTINELLVFVLLVTAGVMARVWLRDIPNFAPVAAISLFAGYFFCRRGIALAIPLLVMLLSDFLIDAGSYPWPIMFTVYGLLTLPVVLRQPMRRYLPLEGDAAKSLRVGRSLLGVFGCSLACSLLFFVGTNFMVWATGSWYASTWAGLLHCFTQAVPFFRYTLAGDAVFAVVLFGSYAAIALGAREQEPAACDWSHA